MQIKFDYYYLGDTLTAAKYKNARCAAVRRALTKKCIRGKNGTMLVIFENGERATVIARRLIKIEKYELRLQKKHDAHKRRL
jgi:hypothetical protein